MHEFDAPQGGPGRREAFEPQHGADDSFHGPVVLLHWVIEVLDLTHLDLGTGFFLERVKGRCVGPTFVDGDLLRETLLSNRFLEEAPGIYQLALAQRPAGQPGDLLSQAPGPAPARTEGQRRHAVWDAGSLSGVDSAAIRQ